MKISGSTKNPELLIAAKSIADQKGLEMAKVIDALEQSIQAVARKKYGQKKIKASINRNTGNISLIRSFKVVANEDSIEIDHDDSAEVMELVNLDQAKQSHPKAEIGDVIEENLPYIDVDRGPARMMKQVMLRLVSKIEREKQYEEYKNRIGTIVSGTVKRLEKGGLVVDLNYNEAYIPSRSLIKGEVLRRGDRIKAYVENVQKDSADYQIILSRTNPQFLVALMRQEVPEIYEGIVEIKGVARAPGSRAKIAVHATNSNIDPVGACIGIRGVRIQAISNELHGEKIDVIPYSSDLATYMVNALTPAEVVKVILDEENRRIEVAVPDNKLNIAIGRKGQNVSLVSELMGWNISIIGEEAESTRRADEFELGTELFSHALNVEKTIAQLLVVESFMSVNEIAESSVAEIANIEGFDTEIATEIKNRAIQYMEHPVPQNPKIIGEIGISENLVKMPNVGLDLLVKLGKAGIKNRENLADLSTDEFTDLIPASDLSTEEIDKIIIHARKQEGWLDD